MPEQKDFENPEDWLDHFKRQPQDPETVRVMHRTLACLKECEPKVGIIDNIIQAIAVYDYGNARAMFEIYCEAYPLPENDTRPKNTQN